MATLESVALNEKLAASQQIIRADDESVALQVRYTGSSATGTIEIDASGDLKFIEGTAADASMTIGGTSGTVDVSNAAATNVGLIDDFINADPNWESKIEDALRQDTSTAKFLDAGPLDATVAAGTDVNFDTSAALHINVALQKDDLPSAAQDVSGWKNELYEIVNKNTYTEGTSLLQVFKCTGTTEEKVYQKVCAATTVEQSIDFSDEGFAGNVGDRLVVKLVGESDCTGTCELRGKTYNSA